jgi:hypothetical protein
MSEKFSVIVPTMWRVAHQFINFLRPLCDNPLVDEIIIINNDTTKTPKHGLSNPKINIVNFSENIYVNPAWNYGVSIAKNNKICLLNDDIMFDIRLFTKLENLITKNNGVFGLYPGDSNFYQEPNTTKNIDIERQYKQRCMGFGCLMFLHKDNWRNIPDELKIFYGDDFIFDYHARVLNKPNFIIKNLDFYTPYSVTSNDLSITNGFIEREGEAYKSIKFNSYYLS